MDRRRFSHLAVVASGALIIGCESEPKPSHTASMTSNDEVHLAVKNLEDVLENLEGDIGDLETQSWRDVIPNVKDGVVEVRNGLEQLKRSLGYSA